MKNLDRETMMHLLTWLDYHCDPHFRNSAITSSIMLLEIMSPDMYLHIVSKVGWSNFFHEHNIQIKHAS